LPDCSSSLMESTFLGELVIVSADTLTYASTLYANHPGELCGSL
jgi:hypothetical protein